MASLRGAGWGLLCLAAPVMLAHLGRAALAAREFRSSWYVLGTSLSDKDSLVEEEASRSHSLRVLHQVVVYLMLLFVGLLCIAYVLNETNDGDFLPTLLNERVTAQAVASYFVNLLSQLCLSDGLADRVLGCLKQGARRERAQRLRLEWLGTLTYTVVMAQMAAIIMMFPTWANLRAVVAAIRMALAAVNCRFFHTVFWNLACVASLAFVVRDLDTSGESEDLRDLQFQQLQLDIVTELLVSTFVCGFSAFFEWRMLQEKAAGLKLRKVWVVERAALRSILQTVGCDAIVQLDADGCIVGPSPDLDQLLNLSRGPESLDKVSFQSLLASDADANLVKEYLARQAERQEEGEEEEVQAKAKLLHELLGKPLHFNMMDARQKRVLPMVLASVRLHKSHGEDRQLLALRRVYDAEDGKAGKDPDAPVDVRLMHDAVRGPARIDIGSYFSDAMPFTLGAEPLWVKDGEDKTGAPPPGRGIGALDEESQTTFDELSVTQEMLRAATEPADAAGTSSWPLFDSGKLGTPALVDRHSLSDKPSSRGPALDHSQTARSPTRSSGKLSAAQVLACQKAELAAPGLLKTSQKAKEVTLLALVMTWNYRRNRLVCCPMHDALREAHKVLKAMSKRTCKKAFVPCCSGPQCKRCGILDADLCDDDTQCMVCRKRPAGG